MLLRIRRGSIRKHAMRNNIVSRMADRLCISTIRDLLFRIYHPLQQLMIRCSTHYNISTLKKISLHLRCLQLGSRKCRHAPNFRGDGNKTSSLYGVEKFCYLGFARTAINIGILARTQLLFCEGKEHCRLRLPLVNSSPTGILFT